MKGLTLTQKEQGRLQTFNQVLGGWLGVREASYLLGLSERHTWRILASHRKEGAAALAHGNRGCRPANTTSEETRQRVITLAHTQYAGFNHTHLTELLAECDGINLARSTVRRLLVDAEIPSPRHRRSPRHRCRRERMPQEGMLIQIDGSHHSWLEEREPWLTLLVAVDDATGKVPYALFSEQEDTEGYFRLMKGIIQQCGIPLAIYSDRHIVFRYPIPAGTASDMPIPENRKPTQFGRAMKELGITHVFAHSPTLSLTPSSTTARTRAVSITTRSLGNGTVGIAYSQTLQATGGSGSYTWIISGGTLPIGLTMNAGVISGTPTSAGAFSFTIQVADNAGETTTDNLSINIQRVTPIISTATLPSGKVGIAYSQTLTATDGVSPYTWSITDGSLPGGLTLNANVIAGTPTTSGSFTFTIQVTDSAGSTAKSSLSINIQSVPVITTTTLPNGEIGLAYSQALAVSGGTSPYTWAISSGTLPGGLTLSGGVISGTPTAVGAFSFSVQIADSASLTAKANLSINIVPAPSISTASLPTGKVGTSYSQTLAVSGGTSPFTWSIITGSLPGGLTLNAGVISGTPTTAGTFSFSTQVTDSMNETATSVLSINITTAPSITTSTLPGGEVGVAYSQTLAVSGGASPYVWSLTAGALPGGLTLNAGVISGTSTAAGAFSFTLQVADSTNATTTVNLSINIVTVPIITISSLPSGKISVTYSQTLTASGGTAPYSWSISTGSLPGGLSLSAGVISGIPTTAGTFNFAVQVTDNQGAAITANLSITIT
jgi:Putative Ig domain